jgi:proteic killer suppression protein
MSKIIASAAIRGAHAWQAASRKPQDMNAPGNDLHPLKGDLAGHWSVWVNGNWRLTFAFDGEDVVLVDYRDYH